MKDQNVKDGTIRQRRWRRLKRIAKQVAASSKRDPETGEWIYESEELN